MNMCDENDCDTNVFDTNNVYDDTKVYNTYLYDTTAYDDKNVWYYTKVCDMNVCNTNNAIQICIIRILAIWPIMRYKCILYGY